MTKVGKKFIPRGATTALKPRGVTAAEEKVVAAQQGPQAHKVEKVIGGVKRGYQVIKTPPPITMEEVISEKVVPFGQ